MRGSVKWIDRAVQLVGPYAGRICLRGDTDFSLTENFDRWDEQGIRIIFGMDARANLVELAEGLRARDWSELERVPSYEIATEPRAKAPRVKEGIVAPEGFQKQGARGRERGRI